MNILPVITRELRAQARQPFTFWVRVLGAVALLFPVIVFAINGGLEINEGGALFWPTAPDSFLCDLDSCPDDDRRLHQP